MTTPYDITNRPGLGPGRAEAPVAHMGMATTAPSPVECDEAEFVLYCFALCDPATYDIAGGQVSIRGEA